MSDQQPEVPVVEEPVRAVRKQMNNIFQAIYKNHRLSLQQSRRAIAMDPVREEAARRELASVLQMQSREALMILLQAMDLILATIQPEEPKPMRAKAAAQLEALAGTPINGRPH